MQGSLYHEIFGDFIKAWDLIPPGNHRRKLAEIADKCFAKSNLGEETVAAWRPRFDDVADSFMFWEANRRASITGSFCEISGKMIVGETGFELRGRADRIDVTHEGKLVIIDYKTGTNPSKKMARSLSPQLSLEGAMANAGAFEKIGKAPVDELLYVRLRAGDKFDAENISTGRDLEEKSAMELAQIAHDRLIKHILDYQNPDQPYVSRYAPVSEKEMNGDYDHLARVREWSIGDDPDLAGDSE
jgi:ATP-dependent helicase/nuclease subunit B